MPHRLSMLFPALLFVAPHSFAQGAAPAAAVPASSAAAPWQPAAGHAPQAGQQAPGGPARSATAPRPAAVADRTGSAATPGPGSAARSQGRDALPGGSGAGADGQPASAAVSERAQREAEHPYFWIRRNGELAYQRYAARLAQARAAGLPPPPTRATTGRPAWPATAFDPDKLPPTSAGPASAGPVVGTPPGAGTR